MVCQPVAGVVNGLNLAILLPCGKRACVVEEDFFVFYLALALFAIMIRAHWTI